MTVRSALLTLLLLFPAVAVPKPQTTLMAAVSLAEAYVAKQNISVDGRNIEKANWHENRAHPEKSYWSIMWVPEGLTLDGQLVVWVFADGTVKHQDGNG